MPFKSPPPSVKRPFKDLTPKVRLHAHLRHNLLTFSTQSTPQKQRPFSASTNGTPLGASSSLASLSVTSPSKYPPSPVSTPSRVLQYSVPESLSSTSSTLPPTPSPIMSEYRNKQRSVYGRELLSEWGILTRLTDSQAPLTRRSCSRRLRRTMISLPGCRFSYASL